MPASEQWHDGAVEGAAAAVDGMAFTAGGGEEQSDESSTKTVSGSRRRIVIIYLCMVLALGFGIAGQVARSPNLPRAVAARVHPPEAFCNFTRIPVGLSWADATPAQVHAVSRAIHPNVSAWSPRNPILIYWHVYTDGKENRSQEVIDRQYALMRDSGLLQAASELRIGYVGSAPLVLPSWNKTRVVAHAATGVECVTTSAMWTDMQKLPANELALLLYIHTRGVTHTATEAAFAPNEGWTAMMEEVNVRRWRVPAALLDNPAETGVFTAGADKCYMGDPKTFGWLYPGNMWWASSAYIRGLMDPLQFSAIRGGNPYYMCSEQWILSVDELRGVYLEDGDNTRDFVLFSTGVAEGKHGTLRMYIDPVAEGIASCDEAGLPSRKPCTPIDLARCHGACCDLIA